MLSPAERILRITYGQQVRVAEAMGVSKTMIGHVLRDRSAHEPIRLALLKVMKPRPSYTECWGPRVRTAARKQRATVPRAKAGAR